MNDEGTGVAGLKEKDDRMTCRGVPEGLPMKPVCAWMWGMKPETLTKRRVADVDDPLFTESLDIYRTSFPVYEQRRIQDFPLAFADPGFYYEVFLNETGRVVSILVTWRRQEFVYLEYFAVDASLRGQGAGQRILEELRDAFPHKLILEIDPPEDGISIRRLGFYQRHGFVPNPQFDYMHPPYTDEGDPFPLLLLTHEHLLDEKTYRSFVDFHHRHVVAR